MNISDSFVLTASLWNGPSNGDINIIEFRFGKAKPTKHHLNMGAQNKINRERRSLKCGKILAFVLMNTINNPSVIDNYSIGS